MEHSFQNGMSPSNLSPHSLWTLWKRRQNDFKSQWGWEMPRTFLKKRTDTHINWQTRSMHRVCAGWFPNSEEGMPQNPTPNLETITSWQSLTKEKIVFYIRSECFMQITFKGRYHAQQEIVNTKWNQWCFWRNFLSQCYIRGFFLSFLLFSTLQVFSWEVLCRSQFLQSQLGFQKWGFSRPRKDRWKKLR